MLDRHNLIISMVHSNGGTVKERTVLQKLACFASLQPGVDGIKHKDCFYGPFGREVAFALDSLVSSLFARETVRSTPIERYAYGLTGDGKDPADKVVEESPGEHGAVKTVGRLQQACSLRARPMSCAARVHFIPESDPECAPSAEETRDMAHGLGWNMTGQEMENGMALLDALAPPRTAA